MGLTYLLTYVSQYPLLENCIIVLVKKKILAAGGTRQLIYLDVWYQKVKEAGPCMTSTPFYKPPKGSEVNNEAFYLFQQI